MRADDEAEPARQEREEREEAGGLLDGVSVLRDAEKPTGVPAGEGVEDEVGACTVGRELREAAAKRRPEEREQGGGPEPDPDADDDPEGTAGRALDLL
jgi:hypothetical protein